MADHEFAPKESEPWPHAWFYPAAVVLAAFASGVAYAAITGNIISLADITDRIDSLCIQALGIKLWPGAYVCVPVGNGAEIHARSVWAISLGVTAITGSACLLHCLVSVLGYGGKRSVIPDGAFRGTFWVVTAFGVVMVWLIWGNANGEGLQTAWVDPIRPAFSTLFDALRSPSRALTVESMVYKKIVPYEGLIIAGALAIYVAVCAACLAPVAPLAPDQRKDPNHLFQLFERRKRVLNRVVTVASVALSLAIASVALFAAWPAALIRGSGKVTDGTPLAMLVSELTDIGNLSTLHWAASMITIGLPAYLIALVYLMVMQRQQAEAAIAGRLKDADDRAKAAEDRAEAVEKHLQRAAAEATTDAERDSVAEKRRVEGERRAKEESDLAAAIAKLRLNLDAAEIEWMKERGVEMNWADILKRAGALLSPLLTGTAISGLSALSTVLMGNG